MKSDRYTVRYTTDGLGGRFFADPAALHTTDLGLAQVGAVRLANDGRCGYVQRTSDGACWHPVRGGVWILDGQEVPA